MANPKQYQGIQIGGVVPQRILGQRDLSPLQNYVQTRNQMWEDAIKQKSAIDVALGNLKLNAAEDKWKYDYGRRIQKKIDDAAKLGDYSRALDTAVLEAGKAVSSPEVMGRIRANEAYEKKKQEVESLANAGTIGGITKERWLAQNKYSYTDTYDNEGNIIGGSEWKAGWEPVRKVDMSRLVTLAGQLASPVKRASSSSSIIISHVFSNKTYFIKHILFNFKRITISIMSFIKECFIRTLKSIFLFRVSSYISFSFKLLSFPFIVIIILHKSIHIVRI